MLICVFGMRGSGKTNLIKGNLEKFRGPVVNLDLLGNYDDPNYVQCQNLKEAAQCVAHYVKSENKKELQKVIVLKTANPDIDIDYMSAILWESAGGTLVLDEADGFDETAAPCFDQLIRYGRNRNVDVITGCRRPFEISRNITAGANKLFIFRTNEPRDIEYFKSTVLGEKALELKNLPKYHGIYVDYDNQTMGIFKTDVDGNIYKLNSQNIGDNMEIPVEQKTKPEIPEKQNLNKGGKDELERNSSSNGGKRGNNRSHHSRRTTAQNRGPIGDNTDGNS